MNHERIIKQMYRLGRFVQVDQGCVESEVSIAAEGEQKCQNQQQQGHHSILARKTNTLRNILLYICSLACLVGSLLIFLECIAYIIIIESILSLTLVLSCKLVHL